MVPGKSTVPVLVLAVTGTLCNCVNSCSCHYCANRYSIANFIFKSMSEYQFKKLLMFGDSITEFAFNEHPNEDPKINFTLGAALTNAYTRKLDVLQRGYSGYTTQQAVYMLPKILKYYHDDKPDAEKIALSYIFFGTNDSVTAPGPQHVDLEQYKKNMRFLINEYKKRDIKVIAFSPAAYDLETAKIIRAESYAKGIFRLESLGLEYGQGLKEVCEEENVPFMDLFHAFKENGDIDLLCDDVHLNGSGYELVYKMLMDTIKQNFPELLPENLPYKFPDWEDPELTSIVAKLE